MELSIIIPAYNEAARLGPMLDRYAPFFEASYGGACELWIVVNGSRDNTAAIAEGYAGCYPQIRVLIEPRAIGKGGAVMLGFERARGRLVGFVDADGATPPEAFQELARQIGPAGAIIASRWMAGSQVNPSQPLKRRVASRLFNTLVRLLFGLRLSDTQCGAKLLTREAMLTVLPHIGITRWAFDVDLLFQLRRAGFAIREIPTVWQDQSGSQLNIIRASTEMALAMMRLRLIYSPLRGLVSLYDLTLGRLLRLCTRASEGQNGHAA